MTIEAQIVEPRFDAESSTDGPKRTLAVIGWKGFSVRFVWFGAVFFSLLLIQLHRTDRSVTNLEMLSSQCEENAG